jgi:hypothetical protein
MIALVAKHGWSFAKTIRRGGSVSVARFTMARHLTIRSVLFGAQYTSHLFTEAYIGLLQTMQSLRSGDQLHRTVL